MNVKVLVFVGIIVVAWATRVFAGTTGASKVSVNTRKPLMGHKKFVARLRSGRGENSIECSATILSTVWAITNAHCVADPYSTTLTVGWGTKKMSTRKVLEVYVHPRYQSGDDSSSASFDLALLKIPHLQFGEHVSSVTILSNPAPQLGDALFVGFDQYSTFVHHVQPKDACPGFFPFVQHPRELLCTRMQNGKELVFGDCGGPLYVGDQVIGLAVVALDGANGFVDLTSEVNRQFVRKIAKL